MSERELLQQDATISYLIDTLAVVAAGRGHDHPDTETAKDALHEYIAEIRGTPSGAAPRSDEWVEKYRELLNAVNRAMRAVGVNETGMATDAKMMRDGQAARDAIDALDAHVLAGAPRSVDRPSQKDCRHEPPYPGADTVLCSLASPDMVSHLPRAECAIQEPHLLANCGAFVMLKAEAEQDTRRLDWLEANVQRGECIEPFENLEDDSFAFPHWWRLCGVQARTLREAIDAAMSGIDAAPVGEQ